MKKARKQIMISPSLVRAVEKYIVQHRPAVQSFSHAVAIALEDYHNRSMGLDCDTIIEIGNGGVIVHAIPTGHRLIVANGDQTEIFDAPSKKKE